MRKWVWVAVAILLLYFAVRLFAPEWMITGFYFRGHKIWPRQQH